jgi:peptide/nickel transport system ATP-binding protein
MTEAAAAMIEVERLTVSFRANGIWQPVVRDLGFSIAPRETVAVVGESGSGKSVTALAIMRLLPERSSRIEGSIRLDGQDLLVLPEKRMRDVRGGAIGMIFQEPMTSLNPVLPIGRQMAEALIRHRRLGRGEADTEALRLFDLVRIPDGRRRARDFPHTLSGGMRQRVMIAMALACRPRLLIADEPTTALDVTIQAQILALIAELQREMGMAVLFITHDMGVVAEIADRTIVMLKGEKAEAGGVADIFARPVHPYTRRLLAAVPKLGEMNGSSLPRRFPAAADALPSASEPDRRGDILLQVEGLTTRFPVGGGFLGRPSGMIHAVENVSFTVRAGETLAIVGESGCGKSTTGRSIMRLAPITAGSIRFEGEDITDIPPAQIRAVRRRMQMIFQDPYGSLNPRKTIGAAISEPMVVHGLHGGHAARDRTVELLRLVGLEPEHTLRFPHEFSGGQRQRICIARALGLAPKLIVADESVSALDVSIKAQIVNLMLDLQARLGLAFLFISHDIAIVERVSHRIAVMLLGEIVEIGPREAVLANPQHPYTKKLISAVPVPDPARRVKRGGLLTEEIASPVRPLGFAAAQAPMVEVGLGHFARAPIE